MPRTLRLTAEAKAAYVAFYNILSLERDRVSDENAKSLIAKARVVAGRLILIHHGLRLACMESDDLDGPVTLESAEAGIAWMRWCLEEQIRVYGFSGAKYHREMASYLDKTIRARLPTLTATVRQVQRLNNRMFATKESAHAAMEQLVSIGSADWTDETHQKIRMKPAP